MSLKRISSPQQQVKRLNTVIAERMGLIPRPLDTISGFGPIFSAGIISEIASVERFNHNQARVAKYAGFKWRKHQSADFQAEETRLTRTGNRYLHYYFCQAANRVRMCDPEYAAYYEREFHEVRKHRHKRALVLTARKLVRLVVRLLRTRQPHQPGENMWFPTEGA